MNSTIKSNFSRWSIALLSIVVMSGFFFRLASLENKVYWHDEAYTTVRSAGYRVFDIWQEIFQDRFLSPLELQKFQQLRPNSTALDTIESLAIEEPQHPPFYFLLSRYWQKFFGFSIVSSRTLSVFFSLLCLPVIYLLSLELFSSRLAAILAVVFLSVSPVDTLLSQVARQNSLLILLTLLAQLFLMRAIRRKNFQNWSLYTIVNILGSYTHLFFIFNIIAQGIFILSRDLFRTEKKKDIVPFFLSTGVTILSYLPWLIAFLGNSKPALDATNWAKAKAIDPVLFAKAWIINFTFLFSDIHFGFDNIFTYLYRSLYIVGIVTAFFTIYLKGERNTFWFLLLSSFVPFLLLTIPDLVERTYRSIVTRYLITCFPTIYLAVAYLFAERIARGKNIWRIIFAIVLTLALFSNYNNLRSETHWMFYPSLQNGEIARKINRFPNAILISDRGYEGTNFGNLLSLNYLLKSKVRYFPIGISPDTEKLRTVLDDRAANVFILHPSRELQAALEDLKTPIDPFYPEGHLWKVRR